MKKYDGVFEKGLSKTRKTMEPAEDTGLDKALYLRFFQKQSQGQPIFSPLLCEKTLNFNKKLGGSDSFVASSGWLATFKNCHGIRQLKLEGDATAAQDFKETFKKIVLKEGYFKDRILNTDETGLNWKALPNKTLASRTAVSAPGHKVSKGRITVLVTANAMVHMRCHCL